MQSHKIWQLLTGILLIVLGISYFTAPSFGLSVIIYIFAFSFLIKGVMNIILFLKSGINRRPLFLISGLFDLMIGFICLFNPSFPAIIISYLVAFWALVTGVIELIKALDMKKSGLKGWFKNLIISIGSFVLFFILITNVFLASYIILYLLATLLIILGVMQIVAFFSKDNNITRIE